ncbi:MAG: response regulator transcription factor [Actinobacteria bacterium]|nr:response regulator transcription factor [Actinomycetota bacterium]
MNCIRVLVVDDHTIIREGIVSMLSDLSVIEVAGEAKNGVEAVRKSKELMPDVVLMDINMPELDGVSATEQIVTENPRIKVLVLTISDDSKDLVRAVKAGAKGYILKDVDKETLASTIKAINKGESIINPAMAADFLEEFRNLSQKQKKNQDPLTATLTDREQEVLKLVAEGLNNKEIAEKLFISESTVKNQVSSILSKLQLKNRNQATAFAVREGITKSI